jgi:signal transduction histidine kinase
MRERVAAMNGELTIRSAPGEGCTVIIVLPLPVSNPEPHAAS